MQGTYCPVLSTFYAFGELVMCMVTFNKPENDSGSRQMEVRNSGDLQMGVGVGGGGVT